MATPIQDLASSVSVLTRDFLDDIAATDLLTAANYFPNAVAGNPASMNDYSVSIRGFPITERLDAARGPNALVFGVFVGGRGSRFTL